MVQVIAVIKRVLANANLANSVQHAGVDAAIDEMMGRFYAEPQHPIMEAYTAGHRRCVGQLEELPTLERHIRILRLLTDQQIDTIFRPLSDMMEAELNFLLEIERSMLMPLEAQRWNVAFQEWSEKAELYGWLIGSQNRNKALLRAQLDSGEPNEGGPEALQTEAITACLRIHSLPLRMLTAKVEFITVSTPATWPAYPKPICLLTFRWLYLGYATMF